MTTKPLRPDNAASPSAPDDSRLLKGARGSAVKILTRVEQSDAYLDKLLDRELSNGELNDQDRRLLTELATGVLRWQGKLDWVLTGFYHGEFSKCIPLVKNALRVALYQILFLDRIPHAAAVNEAVEFVKRLKGERSANLVNGVLRSIIRKLDAITYPDPSGDRAYYLSITSSHPLWMVRRWFSQLGERRTEAMLAANNMRPPLSIRLNPRRGSVDELEALLRADGATVERSPLLPNFLHASHLSGIGTSTPFKEGRYSIQDEGAALATLLTGVRPGMRVIDLCAAPGGKTIAMAEMLEGSGQIVAVDKYEAKLRLIDGSVERLGLRDLVTTLAADARSVELEPADVVLVDAPCSGLGVLAKKPDIKWKRGPEEIEPLAELQLSILRNAARLVRPGGHLVYSTCTIEAKENQQVVERFLEEHPDFELERAEPFVPASTVTPEGYMQTIPGEHPVDGMFGARMRRR